MLDSQNLRRVHRKTAQPQAEQQPRHGHVAGHFAADAHALALCVAFGNGRGDQAEHRRVAGVVEVRHRLVSPVDGQRVLNQVVGADGQKIEVLEEHLHRQRCGRDFDHRAELDGAVGHALVVERGSGMVDQRKRFANFAGLRQHRHQQVDRPMNRRTQDRAQLRQKHRRVSEAPANGAQAERRVELAVVRLVGQPVEWLVRTNIDRAYRHRQALHAFDGGAVGAVLLVFAGQSVLTMAVAVHEQKFAAEQAHADCTGAHRAQRVGRHLDVGEQVDSYAVERDGRGVPQPVQALAFEHDLALPEAVLGEDDRRGIDDQHTGIAVDDDPVILLDQLAGAAGTDNCGDVHAARDDGGVRRFAAHVGGEANEQAVLELQHIGRRDVVCNQDQRHIERVFKQQVRLLRAAFFS